MIGIKDYNEVLTLARRRLVDICNVCPECDGKACIGKVPGCGSKGSGASFTDCRNYFKSIKVYMDAIHPEFLPNQKIEMFGTEFMHPFFVAPIGGMSLNYGGRMSEEAYARAVLKGARESGICAWTGDGPKEDYFFAPLKYIQEEKGMGIVTIKPWDQKKCLERMDIIDRFGAIAVAMDIDSANLINLKLMGKPVYTKSVEELTELRQACRVPFIVKGVLSPKAAENCAKAGVYGIVVSNHGGRVFDDAPVPAKVLPEIRKAVGKDLKILVDGGIRTGSDVFKCLALGADACLIGRPYVIATFGAMEEGVKMLTKKIASELSEMMIMANCPDVKHIAKNRLILK